MENDIVAEVELYVDPNVNNSTSYSIIMTGVTVDKQLRVSNTEGMICG